MPPAYSQRADTGRFPLIELAAAARLARRVLCKPNLVRLQRVGLVAQGLCLRVALRKRRTNLGKSKARSRQGRRGAGNAHQECSTLMLHYGSLAPRSAAACG